jgi:ornithine carbamoyltransferase
MSEINLYGKSFLTLSDFTTEEILYLVNLAAELKEKKKQGIRGNLLEGLNIAMIFEKQSTRTRCATSVAAWDEGARTEYLGGSEIHFGAKESVKDSARVLGRMFDGIMYRGFEQEIVEILAEHSSIPVWNGLTDETHPTQAIADLLTIKENFGKLQGLKVVYIGDGRNNVANSLMLASAMVGINFINCTPKELEPCEKMLGAAKAVAKENGGSVEVINEPMDAVEGANVVYTDVWVSMGEEAEKEHRIELLKPYQVNMPLMEATGNIASKDVIFMHCLPAFHDHKTKVSKECGAIEVTDDVFEAEFSKVFDEAENRMHTIKAVQVATLTNP